MSCPAFCCAVHQRQVILDRVKHLNSYFGETGMVTWEYKSIRFQTRGMAGGILEAEELDHALNELGQQGWELGTVFDTNTSHGGTRFVLATFKRQH
jgi:hypothetical protein